MFQKFQVKENDHGRRLDRVLRKMFPDLGLSQIYSLIRRGQIRLNHKTIKYNQRVKKGDTILIPDKIQIKTEKPLLKNQAKLKPIILFENNFILVINKPKHITVHGKDSLNEMVLDYLKPSLAPSLSFKPGPAHRLDFNTTGLLLFSKSLKASQHLALLFKEKKIVKYYIALFDGEIEEHTIWKNYLFRERRTKTTKEDKGKGRLSTTEIIPLACEKGKHGKSLCLCRLITGRTHQIRIQGSLNNHPLTGDRKYNGSSLLP
jgi:23S rRNA pseudouridine955/2504/2580 synthase